MLAELAESTSLVSPIALNFEAPTTLLTNLPTKSLELSSSASVSQRLICPRALLDSSDRKSWDSGWTSDLCRGGSRAICWETWLYVRGPMGSTGWNLRHWGLLSRNLLHSSPGSSIRHRSPLTCCSVASTGFWYMRRLPHSVLMVGGPCNWTPPPGPFFFISAAVTCAREAIVEIRVLQCPSKVGYSIENHGTHDAQASLAPVMHPFIRRILLP